MTPRPPFTRVQTREATKGHVKPPERKRKRICAKERRRVADKRENEMSPPHFQYLIYSRRLCGSGRRKRQGQLHREREAELLLLQVKRS